MTEKTELGCACGKVRMEVEGPHIMSAECCCNSCREAGARIGALPGAAPVVDEKGATRFEIYRKDRVRFTSGAEHLKEFRLTPRSKTRRVVAACCNTPLFLEFQSGHWLSIYGGLWPDDALPPLEMRTMAMDLPDASVLPDDVPNARRQSASFMWKLLAAWAAMGFRTPKIQVNGAINA
jgi:hypothetical protein